MNAYDSYEGYDGEVIGSQVMKSLSENRKIDAIKMLRKMPTTYNKTENRWCISLRSASYFVQAIVEAQPTSEEVEFEHYKKLRKAGFDIADAMRIIEALR